MVKANCRWYFDQEVQVITFSKKEAETRIYYAAVLPATSSLRSIACSSDNKDLPLCVSDTTGSYKQLLGKLVGKIQRKIGELHSGTVRSGTFSINASKLPPALQEALPPPVSLVPEPPAVLNTPPTLPTIEGRPTMRDLESKLEGIGGRLKSLERLQIDEQHTAENPPTPTDKDSHTRSFHDLGVRLAKIERILGALEQRVPTNGETVGNMEYTTVADKSATPPVGIQLNGKQLYQPPTQINSSHTPPAAGHAMAIDESATLLEAPGPTAVGDEEIHPPPAEIASSHELPADDAAMPLLDEPKPVAQQPRGDEMFIPSDLDYVHGHAGSQRQTDYDTSECDTVMTPSDCTPTAAPDEAAELNRGLIREEVHRALAGAMGTLTDLFAKSSIGGM